MVKFSYQQLVTTRLLLLHAGINLAMRTNELERGNVGSLLMPKRGNFFKSLEFPAIASDSPIAKSTTHSLPVSTNYATANLCRLVKSTVEQPSGRLFGVTSRASPLAEEIRNGLTYNLRHGPLIMLSVGQWCEAVWHSSSSESWLLDGVTA
jgi:hypothetical protein